MKEKHTNSERILGGDGEANIATMRLSSNSQTRQLEAWAVTHLPAHTLMRRAGLAIARLAMAVAPHARVIWVACGPGNNGGDGYEAAQHLKQWGKTVIVTACDQAHGMPADAAASRQCAIDSGVLIATEAPEQYDLCIDALFGIGPMREVGAPYSTWINNINSKAAPVLAVDIPSGLDAETGTTHTTSVCADYTLSLLTLKPGLFTANGRDACGEIWFDSLGVDQDSEMVFAELNGTPPRVVRAHSTHKGSFGDVGIVGGAPGMAGAALLAAMAALHGGAGRVYLALLDTSIAQLDTGQPEVMFRNPNELAYESMTIVAGCGGGNSIAEPLQGILQRAARLVLDADALNAISLDASLQKLLAARPPMTTILTPHPLEAARLMNMPSAQVQENRLNSAQTIADRFACTVVLKGSGTVIAAPGRVPRVNPTGNARLASAGTGDVLAGLIGAQFASGANPFACACDSVYRHGEVANNWLHSFPMTAQDLAKNVCRI